MNLAMIISTYLHSIKVNLSMYLEDVFIIVDKIENMLIGSP
jgi:hypothetical protein